MILVKEKVIKYNISLGIRLEIKIKSTRTLKKS